METKVLDLGSGKEVAAGNEEDFRWREFSDEPAFQKHLLNNCIPLFKSAEVYYPLCTEFAGSPGVDLIYLSPQGKVFIAEMKHDVYQPLKMEQELAYKFREIENKTVSAMMDYIKRFEFEANPQVCARYRDVIDAMSASTFKELFDKGDVSLGCIVWGKPTEEILKKHFFDIYGMLLNKEMLKIYSEPGVNSDSDGYYATIRDYSSQYEQLLKKNRGKRRIKQTFTNLVDYVDKGEGTSFSYLYHSLIGKGYAIVTGTGEGVSFLARVNDTKDRPRTILEVNPESVKVRGNLYNQAVYLGKTEEQIDAFFLKLQKITRWQVSKGKTHKMSIKGISLSSIKAVIDNILDVVVSQFPARRS